MPPTSAGTPVPFGVAPMAAGLAYGQYWAEVLDGVDAARAVSRYRHRVEVAIRYGDVLARVGDRLRISTAVADHALTSRVETQTGVVASVTQRWGDTPVAGGGEGRGESGLVPSAVQWFTRVRVARWVYMCGELAAVHGNHVSVTAAGLPGATVPESLLAGVAERELFAGDGVPGGELVATVDAPLFSGMWVESLRSSDGRGLVMGTATGDVARAQR